MLTYLFDSNDLLSKFRKHSIIAGIIFILLGAVGIIFPAVMSIATTLFIGWLLFFGGILAGYHNYQAHKKEWLGWLKAFLLVLMGLVIVFYPMSGIATLGLLLAIYFLLDGFGSFGMAFTLRPMKGWWWMLVNSIISIALGILFLIGWPLSSLLLIGLLVGISLFFDGLTLLMLGIAIKVE